MSESWKQDVAREFIKENVLNKDLFKIKQSIDDLKENIGVGDADTESDDIFGIDKRIDKIMDIIFNEEGNQRTRIGFETYKLKNLILLGFISEKGKEKLDLLYNELEKSNSEEDLKRNLGLDLDNLHNDISNNGTKQIPDNGGKTCTTNTDKKGNIGNIDKNTNIEGEQTTIETLTESENFIYNQARTYGVTDPKQIAYVLATVKGECNLKNVKEIGGEKKSYGKEGFFGRGYVQLTHRRNYEKFTEIINNSGLKFKDNNGNELNSNDIDLVQNPDLILESDELASFILIYGMKNGSFTGKKLQDYINGNNCDFNNARKIVNGTNRAEKFAKYADDYYTKLQSNGNLA